MSCFTRSKQLIRFGKSAGRHRAASLDFAGDRLQRILRWAAHNVRIHATGVKLIHHPVVGDLELAFESFPLAADPRQSLLTYTAEPGSPSQDALSLLASWAASTAQLSHASKHQNDQQERQEDRQHDPGHDLRGRSAPRPSDA